MMSEAWLKPELFISLVKNDAGYMAIGSRKINFLELEHQIEFGELYGNFDFYEKAPDMVTHTTLKGEVGGYTIVQGATRLAALGHLLDLLDKEEQEEQERARKRADYSRFGGEVNEELIRKVVKWRKKQADKQAYIDDYEEGLE